MEVRRWVLGPLRSNAYVVRSGDEAIVIDPGWHEGLEDMLSYLSGLKVVAIVATHGHFDHVSGVGAMKEATGAPFYAHPADLQLIALAPRHALRYTGVETPPVPQPDGVLWEGLTIKLGGSELIVWETPGHTEGSVSILTRDAVFVGDIMREASRAPSMTSYASAVFTGDTLFKGAVGRISSSSAEARLVESLRRIASLNPATIVYPGHGPPTTIGAEIEDNEYLRAIL